MEAVFPVLRQRLPQDTRPLRCDGAEASGCRLAQRADGSQGKLIVLRLQLGRLWGQPVSEPARLQIVAMPLATLPNGQHPLLGDLCFQVPSQFLVA